MERTFWMVEDALGDQWLVVDSAGMRVMAVAASEEDALEIVDALLFKSNATNMNTTSFHSK